MSYFSSIFKSNDDETNQQQQQEEQRRLTRAQARAQANNLQVPTAPSTLPNNVNCDVVLLLPFY